MTEEDLKKLQFKNFSLLLEELIKQGHGEILYRVVVKAGKVEFISLTKTNTFKPISDIINAV